MEIHNTKPHGEPGASSATKEFIGSTLGNHIAQEDAFLKEIVKYVHDIEKEGAEIAVLSKHKHFASKVMA